MNNSFTNEKESYKFKFSIILSVYNVEEFIEEAVESLIAQSIGFEENVQLVMVDDGSSDSSGEICDKYRAAYPNNVIVVHKENGGLCSARNEGLKHVEGRYVNFFDPDDILSPNTLEDVYNFFSENDDAMDIASIPLVYFGDINGAHHLNDKFKKGTRVINLQKDYEFIQLSLASAFVKLECAKQMVFDPKLVVAEDAEQILKLLINKPFLGVVKNCTYHYRRRGGSQVTHGSTKPGWYNDYVERFSLRSLKRANDAYGYVPKFIQNAVLCDLQWRLVEAEAPAVLDENALKAYMNLVDECVSYIEESVIMRQKHLIVDTKAYLLAKKFGKDKYITATKDEIYYGYDNAINHKFSRNGYKLCFLDVNKESVKISVRQIMLTISGRPDNCYVMVGDHTVFADKLTYTPNKKSIGEVVSEYCMCDFVIPITYFGDEPTEITFYTEIGGATIKHTRILFDRFFPLANNYKATYFYKNGLLFKHTGNSVVVSHANKKQQRKCERELCKELYKSNKIGERKAIVARFLSRVYKRFHKKPLWIISDRLNKSGDNGEALFRYLKQANFKDADYYYAITKCDDYYKLKKLGNVVNRNSLRYKIMHLACDFIISSHADDFVINPFDTYFQPYKNILAEKKYVFLQHGVTKDDISGWLRKYNKNICGFITAAYPEAKSLLEYDYYYNEDEVWLTGFARFDRLYHDEQRYITLMPTWRRYIMSHCDNETGVWVLSPGFKQCEYYKFYNSLLNDERLLAACKKHNYKLAFLPHPNIIPHIQEFDKNDQVVFFSLRDEYKDVYAKSNLVLTDYSSAVFDFAYMRKPLVYAQFDKDEFFKGDHIYTKGYFDYDRDGFGEVAYDYETTVKLLIEYVENDCMLKDEYRRRIDSFFAFNDKNNSKRIVDKILEIS